MRRIQNANPPPAIEHLRKLQSGKHIQIEEEVLNSPILQVAGIFAIGEPRWADKHDEYLAETYIDNHANEK